MRRTHNGKQGFTLVEVIVVLVILAILAAIMIPAMTGWIDKAKEKRLIVACRACVVAAHTLLAEQYGVDGTRKAPDSAHIVALAGVKGTATVDAFFEPNVGQIHKLTYSDGADSVQYDADACETGEYFIFHAGGAHSLGKKADMDAINEVFSAVKNDKNGPISRLDSAAAGLSGTYAIDAVKKLLDEKGIDLSVLGAKAWMFKPHENGNMFVWTTYDISTLPVGTQIPVIRYRPTGAYAGQYTVWMTTVENDSIGIKDDKGNLIYKNVIKNEGVTGTEKTKGLTAKEKEDFDKVLAIYNSLPAVTAP